LINVRILARRSVAASVALAMALAIAPANAQLASDDVPRQRTPEHRRMFPTKLFQFSPNANRSPAAISRLAELEYSHDDLLLNRRKQEVRTQNAE
jgi:hypothetical protein